jgi:hypothetical protein
MAASLADGSALPHSGALLSHPSVLTHQEHPTTAESVAFSPHLSKIHGARARSMEVARWCCRGVGGFAPLRCGALSHPSDRARPTLVAEIDWPSLPLSYVAYVCLKCFRHFRCMLHLFNIDVAKVDWGMLHVAIVSEACCKRMFRVFQMCQRYVSSVFSGRILQVCLSGCCICFTYMLHVFYLDVAYGCNSF